MKKQNVLSVICFLAITFAFSACQKSAAENNQAMLHPTPTVSLSLNPSPTSAPNSDSPIRSLDFKNFKYPWVYMNDSGVNFSEIANNTDIDFFELKDGSQRKNGEQDGADIQKIEYGDVTGDGEEEAIISIYADTGGNCSCDMVYIYANKDGKPTLLWGFGTGDRAQGGLKKIYAENGELVIESFGDNKFENDKWNFSFPKDKFSGYCCPTAYTKIRFKWNGEKFVVQGKPELFDYDWKKAQSKN